MFGPSMTMYTPLFQKLPPTPTLPPAVFEGSVLVNSINLWYGLYGTSLKPGRTPVVFLHGGKISSTWWGHQIRSVSRAGYPVIVIDTRAHGRSSDDLSVPLSYDLFAKDVVALLAYLHVPKANFVGWSDGVNIALTLAMLYRDKTERVFAFGANYQPDQVNMEGILAMLFLNELRSRMKADYEALSPTPENFEGFMARMKAMQDNLPAWSANELGKINSRYENPANTPIVWIVNGDSEEMVQRRVAAEMRDMIKDSSLVILPEVGHLAPLQDAETFNAILHRWLLRSKGDIME